MAVCPAGDDVIGPFLADRKGFLKEVVNPLQEKEEPVYVVPGSDAEAHVARRFPHKTPKRVGSGRRPRRSSASCPPCRTSSSGKPAGLDATYHFTFTGEEADAGDGHDPDDTIRVEEGHVGTADLRCDRRQPDLARLPGEGAEPAVALLRRNSYYCPPARPMRTLVFKRRAATRSFHKRG